MHLPFRPLRPHLPEVAIRMADTASHH